MHSDDRIKANIEKVIDALSRCPVCGSNDECACTEEQKDEVVRIQWRDHFAKQKTQ